jgi:hypothetical protein
LKRLLNASPSNATATLDTLYLQILRDALNPDDPEQDLFQQRLLILHTLLCTIERTSPSVVTHLLHNPSEDDDDDHPKWTSKGQDMLDDGIAKSLVAKLHAVLYHQGHQVMWFHKSFPDFIFDRARSTERYHCNQVSHHSLLAAGCLRIMRDGLHFNMADIPDASTFDKDNPALQASVERHIRPPLMYASQSWSQHLTAGRVIDSGEALQTLHGLLQLPVLFWIETMNLLGLRGRCDDMLRKARDWMSSTKVYPALSRHYRPES